MSNQKKTVSIVVPVFNEEQNILRLYENVVSLFERLSRYAFEIIFVDDGSTDRSLFYIDGLALKDRRVKCLEFSRNFGKEAATSAGLHAASGDAVLLFDADLQYPLSLVPRFLEKWESGADLVVGVRKKNHDTGFCRRICSRIFYAVVSLFPDSKLEPHATDFRLLDRSVRDAFLLLSERERLTRGLIDWLGFRREKIEFEADPRNGGVSGYSHLALTRLAVRSLISETLFPLKIAGYLGCFTVLLSGILGIFIFFEMYVLDDPWRFHFSGTALLAVFILFLVGIVLICLGLIALYIGSIHSQVSNRPIYIIRSRKNFFQ